MAVLVGFDDTSYGRDALALGLDIAARRHDPVTVVTAYPDDERGLFVAVNDQQWVRQVRAVATDKLRAAEEFAAGRGEVTYEPIGPASASRAIHEYAERTRPAALVLGSSERAAIGRVSFGSTVQRLLPGAPCPVAVAPRGYHKTTTSMTSIAVAYDETPESRQALDLGIALARRDRLTLRIVTVTGSPDPARQARLDELAAGISDGIPARGELIVAGDVVDTLADLPGTYPSLLLCGSRGYGALRQVILGSVSARLVRNAAYPVIVVPRSAGTGRE